MQRVEGWDGYYIDSIFTTEEAAEARAAECRTHPKWRNDEFHVEEFTVNAPPHPSPHHI